MKQESGKGNLGRCASAAFGFEPISENNSDSRKVLTHFNMGFKLNHTHDEDSTDIELIQGGLL